jgi:DNA invertase Pin-like site-specific DNA recombinase
MPKKTSQHRSAALYARESTDGQSTKNQLRELRHVAKRIGWEIVAEFVDYGVSCAKSRDKRPHTGGSVFSATQQH